MPWQKISFKEVFIKIIDTLRKDKYNHEGKFVQWAMRISLTTFVWIITAAISAATTSPLPTIFNIFDVLKHSDESVDSAIMPAKAYDRIRALVDMLPEEQREVVILCHYAD